MCFYFNVLLYIFVFVLYYCCIPHSFVQACAAAADEDHCMILSLSISAVWLCFLALRCLYGVLDSGQLLPSLVDRHSVPWACLPLPPLVPFGLLDIVCLGPVFLFPGLTLSDLTVDFVCMCVHMVCLSVTCGLSS